MTYVSLETRAEQCRALHPDWTAAKAAAELGVSVKLVRDQWARQDASVGSTVDDTVDDEPDAVDEVDNPASLIHKDDSCVPVPHPHAMEIEALLAKAELVRDELSGLLGGTHRPLAPCGTHAAFVRHWKRGETPDDPCRDAERAYQSARARRMRALRRGAA